MERIASTIATAEKTRGAASGSGMVASTLPHPAAARVLIVDDEAAARRVLSLVLSQIGYQCETAASGEEALRALNEGPMDAVISDLQMPRVSGMELLSRVRHLYPQLVFLMVTGVDDIQQT